MNISRFDRNAVGLLLVALVGATAFACGGSASDDAESARTDKSTSQAVTCGGFAGLSCSAGETCVDDPSDSCDPAKGDRDCGGICTAASPTPTPTAPPTPTPTASADASSGPTPPSDPGDAAPRSIPCGGIAPIACPAGLTCVDVPEDGCDPVDGGADCPGVCIP